MNGPPGHFRRESGCPPLPDMSLRRSEPPVWATCGLIAPQQTKPLFDDLVRAAEQRERETTVASGHATLATRGHYPLSGPDFHRLDRTSLRLVHSLDYLVGERA